MAWPARWVRGTSQDTCTRVRERGEASGRWWAMPGTSGRSHRPASLCSRHQAVPACRTDMRRWRCAGASMWRLRGGRVADVHFPFMGVVLQMWAFCHCGVVYTPVLSLQLVQQHLGLLQVDGVKAFREPAIDRREALVSLSALALLPSLPHPPRMG